MSITLLDVVQDVLSVIDSDAVSSISDTVEADQVADIVKNVYRDIVTEYNLPGKRTLETLEGLSDPARPNMLRIPDNIHKVLHWQYDCRLAEDSAIKYKEICYLEPTEFLRRMNQRNSLDGEIYMIVYPSPNVTLLVDKTRAPEYWTTFDDRHIVTDNFNLNVDAALQGAKTQAWLERRNVFVKSDTFIIELPAALEQLLFRTAENEAYALNKQIVNPKLEQKEARLRIRAQRNKHAANPYENNTMSGTPNYGRK